MILVDTYGRILTEYNPDGNYNTAVVYVPGDSRIDWDSASDSQLVALLNKYGYNNALTIEGGTLNVTISDNGETETLVWDAETMDFTVDIDQFQNGAQNMYFRTVNDGNRDVTVLVDEDGKAIQAQTLGDYTDVLFSVANNGTEIDTITSGSTYSRQDIINACGGAVNVTALEAGEEVFLLVKDNHVQYCNGGNTTTTPAVTEVPGIPTAPLYYQEVQQVFRIVDSNGKLLVFKAGASLLHLARRMNEETYYWDGQPLDMEKTLPLEYVSGEQTYIVGDYTIYQSQSQQITITPEPTEFT